MKQLTIILSLLLICSCGGNKKQRLEPDVSGSIDRQAATHLPQGETFGMDEQPENRSADPDFPAVVLDISGTLPVKAFDLSAYYPSVRFITLRHPKQSEGTDFLIPEGMTLIRPVPDVPFPQLFPKVLVTDDKLLVGNLQGLFCYDKEGHYRFTIFECPKPPVRPGNIQLSLDAEEKMLADFSTLGDLCLYSTIDRGKSTLYFYELKEQKEVSRAVLGNHRTRLLNAAHRTFVDYNYQLLDSLHRPFLYTLNARGDTLCRFMNENVLPVIKSSTYQNPGVEDLYYFNDRLLIRQVGNDTVFRVSTESRLSPAYIFHTGARKATIQDLMTNQKKGKRFVEAVRESGDFLLFSLHENGLAWYDKKEKRLYRQHVSPQKGDVYVPASAEETLPVSLEELSFFSKGASLVFSKSMLNRMMAAESFSSFPPHWQKKMKAMADELKDGEILLMIIE